MANTMRSGKSEWVVSLSLLAACALGGLVAVTPGAGYITVGQSVFIGLLASIVSDLAVHWKTRSPLDDTLDVFSCHGVGGIVWMLATSLQVSKSERPDR